jgi:large subunit ribosomal protein L3
MSRTGIIAKKLGMTHIYDEFGQHVAVTVLQIDNLQVVAHKTSEKDGYDALQLGFGSRKVKNVTKPLRGHYSKSKVEPKAKLVEFRVSSEAMVDVGATIMPSHFVDGQYVDVIGVTKGKGFAGAMKRHNFRGLEASHGVSISHRSHGSTGGRQDPGKVFKNKKMAGHLGDVRVTQQNLTVVKSDDDLGVIYIKGAVPGANNSYVMVKDAVKKAVPASVPMPAKIAV